MVVLERGEIPNQVWNDIYYIFRPFIIVFFFDLSSKIFTCQNYRGGYLAKNVVCGSDVRRYI